jgi:1-acyl-sn-glycerol-3-phosphate acyltransferase
MIRLNGLAERARLGEVGRFAPWIQRTMGQGGLLGGTFRLLFRPRLSGWENLPESGAYLIVVNHSGGGGADVAVLAALWAERFGGEHRLAAMAHPLAFYCPGIASLVRGLGAIPSSYAHALEALRAGTPVLVFPGGDHEAFRPVWQSKRVDFNGRQGFLRLAREAGVPIVPLGLRDASLTNPILWRSRLLAWLLLFPRLLGLKRFPLTLSGALGAALLSAAIGPHWGPVPALLASWVWLMLPTTVLGPWVPWTVSGAIGAPLAAEALFGAEGARPLEEAHEEVRAAVQSLVTPEPT